MFRIFKQVLYSLQRHLRIPVLLRQHKDLVLALAILPRWHAVSATERVSEIIGAVETAASRDLTDRKMGLAEQRSSFPESHKRQIIPEAGAHDFLELSGKIGRRQCPRFP